MADPLELARYKTGTIADGLDQCSLYDQALPPALRLLVPASTGRLVGRAKVVRYTASAPEERNHRVPKERSVAFQKKLEAYLKPGDVAVLGFSAEVPECEVIGGFMARLIQKQGTAGVVIDGYVRDLDEITEMKLATVARGVHPSILRGRVKAVTMGEPVRVGKVTIKEGDLIVADVDGTLVVPPAAADDVIAFCEHVASLETKAWADVQRGDAISDVFDRYGVF